MNRFREQYLKMRSSFADAPEPEPAPLPDLDAPATPADIRQLQQVEAAFGSHLPENYESPLQPAENDQAVSEPADVPLPEASEVPDGPEIMDKLIAFMRRFLVCSDDQLLVLALWVLHTWCYEAFHLTPCLNIYSLERRAGKTQCLQLLRWLCPDSWYAAAPSPVAVIQKTLRTRFTILIDDRHLTFSPSGRQQVVNYLACGLVDDELYSHFHAGVNGYNVFSPRALAGRGPLPAALADRSIPICLRPAKPSGIKRIRFIRREPDHLQLLQWLRGWADQNLYAISLADPDSCRGHLPSLNAHQQNHLEPLLMLAYLLGEECWLEKARLALTRIFRDAGNDKTNQAIQLLYDIREAFRSQADPQRLSTSFLVDYLCGLANRPWAEWNDGKPLNGRSLALLLERFQIAPDKQRTGDLGSVRGYARNAFLPRWREYFDDLPEAGCSASSTGTGTTTGTPECDAV